MSEGAPFHDLIRRVRMGDEQAAVELVRDYLPAIRVVVRRRLKDPSLRSIYDSMDVCQSVLASFFVRVALGHYQLDSEDQLINLLATMALNKVRNHKERQEAARRDRRRELKDSPAAREVADPHPTPGQTVATKELLQEIRKRMSEEEQMIEELLAAGHSWKEITARVGGTPDAVRMRFQRALARIEKELGL